MLETAVRGRAYKCLKSSSFITKHPNVSLQYCQGEIVGYSHCSEIHLEYVISCRDAQLLVDQSESFWWQGKPRPRSFFASASVHLISHKFLPKSRINSSLISQAVNNIRICQLLWVCLGFISSGEYRRFSSVELLSTLFLIHVRIRPLKFLAVRRQC